VAEALQDVSETDALESLARRYWRQHARDEPLQRIRKLWAFLLRRGFPGGLVQERLGKLWPRWREGLEDLPEE
jgi:SOS response regulatory protein OraA/RecX